MTKKSLLRTMMMLSISTLAISIWMFGQSVPQTQMAGGNGGNPFQDTSIAPEGRMVEVRVSAGTMVDSIQVIYELPDGRTVTGPLHGGPGGRANSFRLDSDEYIIGISGRYGKNIDCLRIHTNKRTSPLYGGTGGRQDFKLILPSGNQAVAFFGRSGNLLDAIGLAYAPVYMRPAGQTEIAGGSGGTPFVDTQIPMGARISEIRLNAGNYIDGIQVVYMLPDGSTVEGPHHGGDGGIRYVFKLDSSEYVVRFSGRFGQYLDSLTIHTNRRTSTQFGGGGGRNQYDIQVPSGSQAIALTGRSGKYMDAIGLRYTFASRSRQDYFRRRRN